ncbi:MAG TPA: choice-of-anchor P family protein [Candidatus Thermoplasmatota archaeon]|jgi:hypothetical protein|nr:choice-of-anchor P family protein [Candidatus Thermoplasmatota archaeon]
MARRWDDMALAKFPVLALATILAATGLSGDSFAQDPCVPSEPDPTTATANGSAVGLRLDHAALGLDVTEGEAASTQTGPGSSQEVTREYTVENLVQDGDIQLHILTAAAQSSVATDPPQASQLSFAEVADVSLLDGLVRADFLRAVASASANSETPTLSRAGTVIVGLEVNGYAISDHTPNTQIWLPSSLFGRGSYVVVNEQLLSASQPPYGQLSGGSYMGHITVNALHVHIIDANPLTPGDQPFELRVASADAFAEFPQATSCSQPLIKYVSATAHVVRYEPPPGTPVVTFEGGAGVRASGGHDEQHLVDLTVPESAPYLLADSAASMAEGALGDVVTAAAFAEVQGICTQPTPACYLTATVVRADAEASATRLNDTNGTFVLEASGATTLVGVKVSSFDLCAALGLEENCTPPPNTVHELPGIGFIVLNEQIPDLPSLGHAGITVRAIRLVVTAAMPADEPLELIVSQAHAGATFDP